MHRLLLKASVFGAVMLALFACTPQTTTREVEGDDSDLTSSNKTKSKTNEDEEKEKDDDETDKSKSKTKTPPAAKPDASTTPSDDTAQPEEPTEPTPPPQKAEPLETKCAKAASSDSCYRCCDVSGVFFAYVDRYSACNGNEACEEREAEKCAANAACTGTLDCIDAAVCDDKP